MKSNPFCFIVSIFSYMTHSFDPALIEEFPESSFLFKEKSSGLVKTEPVRPDRSLASLDKYPAQYRDEISFLEKNLYKIPR